MSNDTEPQFVGVPLDGLPRVRYTPGLTLTETHLVEYECAVCGGPLEVAMGPTLQPELQQPRDTGWHHGECRRAES